MEHARYRQAKPPKVGSSAEQDLACYIPALRRYFLRKTRESQIVDDLIQDVMLRMHARQDPKPLENLHGYIFRTASSVLHDHFRRNRVRRIMISTDFTEIEIADVESTPDRVIQAREEIERVIEALNELPERTRDVFLMRRYEGLAYGEIAHRTGLSVSSLEKHVAKAAAHLARRIIR